MLICMFSWKWVRSEQHKPQVGTVNNSQNSAATMNWERVIPLQYIFWVSLSLNPSFLWRILRKLLLRQATCVYTPLHQCLLFSIQHSECPPRLPLTRCDSSRGWECGIDLHRVCDLQDRDAAIGQADGHHGGTGRVPLQVVDHGCTSWVLGQFVTSKCLFLLFCLLGKTNTWDTQSGAQHQTLLKSQFKAVLDLTIN